MKSVMQVNHEWISNKDIMTNKATCSFSFLKTNAQTEYIEHPIVDILVLVFYSCFLHLSPSIFFIF